MKEFVFNIIDVVVEKYVFVIEVDGNNVIVKVSSIIYLMIKEYYIVWVYFMIE